MIVMGVLLMGVGVGVILSAPDLSGFTVLGAVLFLLGLWIVQAVAVRPRRVPMDSTSRAVTEAAQRMVS